jgi:hypothetical protein
VIGTISAVALSFMVQEPRGIIAAVRDRSLPLEAMEIPQHLCFGVVAVEDGMGEVGGGAG